VDLIGKTLGKYQIVEEIGRGGMGAMYKGYDPTLNRTVAVKVLAPHLAWEPHFVNRVLREARMVARLSHPHIVSIFNGNHQTSWSFRGWLVIPLQLRLCLQLQ
jgi:serine/threonine protein kinase